MAEPTWAADRITELEEALRELVNALDRCRPEIEGAFAMARIHGIPHAGETYGDELEAARRLLQHAEEET